MKLLFVISLFIISVHHIFCLHPCIEPLDSNNDTLCGVTDVARLTCHYERWSRECSKRRGRVGGHWTSVCLFLIEDERPGIREDFLVNYKNYTCAVMGSFGTVNCSSKLNPRLNFNVACNYTFYFCRGDPLSCFKRFNTVLEEGGRCPPPSDNCPSQNLFSLTSSLVCHEGGINNEVAGINYTVHPTLLDIKLPDRCVDKYITMYVILLLVVVGLLIILLASVLFQRYRKLKAGVLATMDNDDVIKMGDQMNEDWNRFLELHQDTDSKENVDAYIPKVNLSPKKHSLLIDAELDEPSSENHVTYEEDQNLEAQALISNSTDTVRFVGNPIATQNHYEMEEIRESDEESAAFDLKTYILKKKENDSTSNLVLSVSSNPPVNENNWRSPENDQTGIIEDEEKLEFELKTYSLKRKLNSSESNLDQTPLNYFENKHLLSNAPISPNEDQNFDFPGYLKKNESQDLFQGDGAEVSLDYTDKSIDNNGDIFFNDSAFTVPNYMRKTDNNFLSSS